MARRTWAVWLGRWLAIVIWLTLAAALRVAGLGALLTEFLLADREESTAWGRESSKELARSRRRF